MNITAVIAALVVLPLTVQHNRMDESTRIVTNTADYVASATNDTLAAARAYSDKVSGTKTNDVQSIIDENIRTNNVQKTLISGTSIKTINGESLLGSGNIEIHGGGGVTPSVVTGLVESASITNKGAVAEAKAYSSSTFAPKVDGGYLPLNAGSAYPISKDCAGLFLGESGYIDFYGDNESWHTPMYITFDRTEGKFLFGLEADNESPLIPDSSPIVTMSVLSDNYLPLEGGTMTGAITGYAPTIHTDPSFIAMNIIQFGHEDNKIGDLGAGYMNYSSLDGEHNFYTSNFEGLQSKLTVDGTDVLTATKAETDYPIITSSASDFAPAVEGGYLPLSAGDYYSLNGDLWIGSDERTAQDAHRIVFATDKYPCYIKATEKNTTGQSKFVFGMEDDEDYDSSLTPDGSPVLTATKATTDYPIITHAASEFASAAPDTNGYLPRSAGENYPLTGPLYLNDSNCYLHGNNDSGGFLWIVANAIAFSDGSGPGTRSDIFPDGTPVMTEGKADYHIVSNATVTSGQIANVDLAGLSCKTVNVNFASATTKAGDALLWTGGNTEDCTMVFSVTPNTLVPHGDDGYLKATANKKCLFLFDKVSATDIIITKKEFN